jgi:hypothetical protein
VQYKKTFSFVIAEKKYLQYILDNRFKHIRFLLVSVVLLYAQLVMAQREPFMGIVISDENAKGVPLASVINLNTGQKTLSTRAGFLRIAANQFDTLQISSVGYEILIMPLADVWKKSDTTLILMSSKSYELKSVTVVYSNARRDSIARLAAEILKTDPLLNNNDRILNRPRGGGLTGVLTEMYYEFSKAGQDMVKFEAFVKYYREQQIIDKRYNKVVIERISGLESYYLDDFIIFCRPDRNFLLTSNDYDLYAHILNCAKKFKDQFGLND